MTSKVLLERLNGMGEYVKSASSTIETPVVRRYNEKFPTEAPKAEAPAAAKKAPATRPAPAKTRRLRPPGCSGCPRPHRGSRRDGSRRHGTGRARPEHVGARAGRSRSGCSGTGRGGPGCCGSRRAGPGDARPGGSRPRGAGRSGGPGGPGRP